MLQSLLTLSRAASVRSNFTGIIVEQAPTTKSIKRAVAQCGCPPCLLRSHLAAPAGRVAACACLEQICCCSCSWLRWSVMSIIVFSKKVLCIRQACNLRFALRARAARCHAHRCHALAAVTSNIMLIATRTSMHQSYTMSCTPVCTSN